jgi:DNA-binding protein Fis
MQSNTEMAGSSDWLNPGYDFSKEEFVLEDAINRLVQLVMRESGGNASRAARMLGVTRDFIRYRLHGDRKDKQ